MKNMNNRGYSKLTVHIGPHGLKQLLGLDLRWTDHVFAWIVHLGPDWCKIVGRSH